MITPHATLDLHDEEVFIFLAFQNLAESVLELDRKQAEKMISTLEMIANRSENQYKSYLEKVNLIELSFKPQNKQD